jgi:hypothetical protein
MITACPARFAQPRKDVLTDMDVTYVIIVQAWKRVLADLEGRLLIFGEEYTHLFGCFFT